MLSRRTIGGLMVGLGLVLGASCGEEPVTPTTPTVTTTSLTMAGPEAVAPGASAQFTVTSHRSDGTTVDSTNQVVWSSSNTNLLTISPTGMASGWNLGETSIRATLGTRSSTRTVLVLSDGTFRVTGRVDEVLASGSSPLPGARVEVTSGLNAGRFTTTDSAGNYRLYGITGETELKASRSAYRDHIQRVLINSHQTIDFGLRGDFTVPLVEGSYTLTITAAASCRDALPEAARVRTHTAAVTRDGRVLKVLLSGGTTLISPFNRFGGRVELSGLITFTVYSYYYYYYGGEIVERFGNDRLYVGGWVNAQASSSGISGTLQGSIRLATERGITISNCYANDHGFEFRR